MDEMTPHRSGCLVYEHGWHRDSILGRFAGGYGIHTIGEIILSPGRDNLIMKPYGSSRASEESAGSLRCYEEWQEELINACCSTVHHATAPVGKFAGFLVIPSRRVHQESS